MNAREKIVECPECGAIMIDSRKHQRHCKGQTPHITRDWDEKGNPICVPDCPRCAELLKKETR